MEITGLDQGMVTVSEIKQCSTCEYWDQASTMAFQNPPEGIWGRCRLPLESPGTFLLTNSGYCCIAWELD